jgi:hypothetical protein
VSPGRPSGVSLCSTARTDGCGGFAANAVAAGLNERMVRLAEHQGEMMAQIVRAALADPELALPQDNSRLR